MSNVKIEQVGEYSNKLDAIIKVTKTVEQVDSVTFMGMIGNLAAAAHQIEMLEAKKEELIDLLATVAAAQTYSDEEIEIIKSRVQLDEETKVALLAEIKERVEAKRAAGEVEVVGAIMTESIVPPAPVVEEPAAQVDPAPVTVEETVAEEVAGEEAAA